MTELQRKQKQTIRLKEGRCPVHGLPMSQISRWYDNTRRDYCYGGCPRKDCNVAAKFHEPFGRAFDACQNKWKIESENRWQYLSLLEEDPELFGLDQIEKLRTRYEKLDALHGVTL